ncbi:hypothetical protein PGB90_008121 [Kerria lacca]
MMQRLLQSEEHTNLSGNDAESSSVDRKAFDSMSYQYVDREKEISDQNQTLFLKSFSTNNINHLHNLKDNLLKFDKNNLRRPFFNCEDRKIKLGHAFQEYKQLDIKTEEDDCSSNTNDKNYHEEFTRRLFCDSEDATDVTNPINVSDDRISSEEEYVSTNKEDDVRSPVDLTNRRLLETNNYEGQSSGSITEDSTTLDDSCKNETMPNNTARRLTFSVENILDPNKFTGKQLEDSIKEKIIQPYNWRPHLDFMDTNSPVNVNRAGK